MTHTGLSVTVSTKIDNAINALVLESSPSVRFVPVNGPPAGLELTGITIDFGCEARLAMATGRNSADCTFLTKRNKRWRRLPEATRDELRHAVGRIDRIRKQIGADAAVKIMPPVEILDEIWMSSDEKSLIGGRATAVSIGGKTWFGARLPATTAVLQDDALIRRVLVHEFAHCFHFLTRIIDAADSGCLHDLELELGGNGPVLSRADDDLLLVDPVKWFAPSDAAAMMHWHDWKWTEGAEEARIEAIRRLRQWLPVTTPKLVFDVRGISFTMETADHIRRLRVSDGQL